MSDAASAPADYVAIYRRAFQQFGAQALWNKRQFDQPSPEDGLVIARALRLEGDLDARRLAEELERDCRAAL